MVGDSFLRRTEAPICFPDLESREMWRLLGGHIQGITERLPELIHPSHYYPVLLVHMGISVTASSDMKQIREDYEALGRRIT